jgi:hypothetical protein
VSLLDGGPDTLTVWAEIEILDDRRNPVRVPGDTPVTVNGRLQPVSSDETAVEGQQVSTLRRFIVGEPAPHNGSARTRHVTVLLRARAPEDAPDG